GYAAEVRADSRRVRGGAGVVPAADVAGVLEKGAAPSGVSRGASGSDGAGPRVPDAVLSRRGDRRRGQGPHVLRRAARGAHDAQLRGRAARGARRADGRGGPGRTGRLLHEDGAERGDLTPKAAGHLGDPVAPQAAGAWAPGGQKSRV
ncbi:MAG: Sulfur acceptor protein _ iron-sulfur cluster assembly SufE, partial [uncultured Rubrobacteraceae bacterium]